MLSRRALPFLLTSLLAAQSPAPLALQALDQVPPDAHSVLLMRDPLLTRMKVQALMQRFGSKENPLADLQTLFGLPRLDMDPRGIALLAMAGANGDKEASLLLVPAKDAKAFAESLHAKPLEKEPGLFAYSAGKQAMLLGWKNGWALLAPAAEGPVLRKVLKSTASIRRDLGDLESWAQGGDFSGITTPQGLEFRFGLFRRMSMGAAGPQAQMAQIMGQMERELTHIAFRGALDADGNLDFSLRCKLLPGGEWSSFGRDLQPVSGLGLSGLGSNADFIFTAGGGLPAPWMPALMKLNADFMAEYEMGKVDHDGALAKRLAQLDARVRSATVLQSGESSQLSLLQVDDSKAYLAEYKAIQDAVAQAQRAAKSELPVSTTEASTVEGYAALITFMDMASDMDLDAEIKAQTHAMAMEHPSRVMLALDGGRLLVLRERPSAEFLKRLLQPERPLADNDALAALAKHLPERAHFYAFIAPTAANGAERKGEAVQLEHMDEDLKAKYPQLPKVADAPPMGFALRFDLDGWQLDGRIPAETQVGIGGMVKDGQQNGPARMKLSMEQMERNRRKREQEQAAPPKEPDAKSGDEDEED